MNPAQFEWQTRCEFNAYCKHTLRNELIDALRESKKRERNEVSFSALTPQEEKQLYRFYNLFWGAKVTVQMRVLSAPTFFQ